MGTDHFRAFVLIHAERALTEESELSIFVLLKESNLLVLTSHADEAVTFLSSVLNLVPEEVGIDTFFVSNLVEWVD